MPLITTTTLQTAKEQLFVEQFNSSIKEKSFSALCSFWPTCYIALFAYKVDSLISTVRKKLLGKQNTVSSCPFFLRHFKTEALQDITQFFAFIIKWESLICNIVTLPDRNASVMEFNAGSTKASFYNIRLQRNYSDFQHTQQNIPSFLRRKVPSFFL